MSKIPVNPFPGLRPFQKNESNLFFGRQNHIKEILRKLETYRFVSIVGNSGSGKSSLVRAGVLPQIENNKGQVWKLCIMRPGKNPVEELCEALFEGNLFGKKDAGERKNQVKENIEILNKNRLGIVQAVRNVLPEGERLLILVDQFEELFRFSSLYVEQNNNAASHFVELLLGAVGQKEVPVYVMMTVRSDFLGDCEQFMGLPEAINDGQFLIPRMNREEMQSSITGPVDVVEGKISPHLVHQLLNEVGSSPDQLPVLQHVLMRTWEVWQKENNLAKPVDIDQYKKTGGMEKALSNHAEEAFEELNTDRKKKLAEAIFKTITLKGGDNRGIRRPTSLDKIALITNASLNEIIEIINIFRRADRGFLMPPATTELNEKSVLDISHESLMRVWERLGTWVEEEAESAEIYHRVCESALLYDKNMAGLWRDPDLQIAVEWREKNEPNQYWASQYNDNFKLAMRFIDASIQDKKFMLAEANRRKNLTRIVVSIFLIALSLLTIWAYLERNQSEKSKKLALSEKLNAEQQEAIAKEQKLVAEENSIKAEREKSNAEKATLTAFEQRKIAVTSAKEAEIQKLLAEKASLNANDARRAAEIDKQIALKQRELSDSLKTIAFQSEKNAYRLRVLSIASNLAIKSAQAKKGTYDDGVKPLLALQANNFNKSYNGKAYDPDIFKALFSSLRFLQNKSEYFQNFHTDAVRSVCFSPDGKNIASAGNDGKLFIFGAANLQSDVSNFNPQPLLIENIEYCQDGSKIAASADNKTILIYDVANAAQKPKVISGLHSDKISALLWYKSKIVTACFDMKIRLIDETSLKVSKTISLPSKPLCLSLMEDKGLLVAGCENGTVYLVNLATGSEAEPLEKITTGRVTSLDFNADGSAIVCGTSEGNFKIFNRLDKTILTISAHTSSITMVKFSPKDNIIASSSLDGTVKLWNMDTPDEQPIVFEEHDSWVWAIAFSPDGSQLASCGKDKTVRTYSIQTPKMVKIIESKVNRNFTANEWNTFIGSDIPYEKTIGQ
ncbi:MAG: hypothetical protein ACKVQB_05285 [Bacteroidia bacterium]